jgi:uncharacterized protein
MKALDEFKIPIYGLRKDHYQFEYQIDKSFFDAIEEPLYTNGNVAVKVFMEKGTGMITLDFEVIGTVQTECDRCLSDIQMPIKDKQCLFIKYSEEEKDSADDEIVYIHPETPSINLSHYIYEYICIAVPFIKTFDCEALPEPPCDQTMLSFLTDDEGQGTVYDETDDDDDPPNKTIWDDLRDKLN